MKARSRRRRRWPRGQGRVEAAEGGDPLVFHPVLRHRLRDGQEGQPASDQVIDLLRKIASRTKAIVLVTIRQRTMQERDKDFRDFLKLGRT